MNENDSNWIGLIDFIKDCDKPMNELDKLRKMLDEAKIPYESYQEEWVGYMPPYNFSGEAGKYRKNQVIYGKYDIPERYQDIYNDEYNIYDWKIDGICHYGSHEAEKGLIETYGDLGTDENGEPMVMTAQEVFDIIKADWEEENKQ